MSADGSVSLAEQLAGIRDELDGLVPDALARVDHEPGTLELLESVRVTLEQLRLAQRELERRNDELSASRAEIERERRLYEDLFELAPDAYLVTDASGLVLDANRTAEQLFGREQRFLLRKPLAALVAEENRRDFRLAVERLRAGEVVNVDVTLAGRDRAPVRLNTTAAAADTPDGEVFRWILRDVTVERQREAELRVLTEELEARVAERTGQLTAVMNNLPVAVVVVDGRTRRVVDYNPRAADLLGPRLHHQPPVSDFATEVRRAGHEPVAPDDWPSARALAGEVVVGERLAVVTGEGDEHLFEVSAAPVTTPDGRIVSAVLVFQDVAERERRDQAVRAFVTNAAHELGTPLAGIIASVEALKAGAKDDAVHRDRFLDHIGRESARLDRLMRALLVLARAQARAEAANLAVVPLEPLVSEVALSVSPGSAVRVEVSCPPDVAALANRPLLEQALVNLAGNAARYTARGMISLSVVRAGADVEIAVADTGPGIPADVRARLFERFVRGPQAGGGFGLGLAIARDSVEATGGSLELEDRPGGGTRAVIRLPAARLVAAA